jgi:hypothetical protein
MKTRRIDRFDALRICVQSLVASALAYAAMKLLASPALTWGVFSSLFTLQVNFDRSLKYGIGMMIGAVTGTIVGMATLHVFPIGDETLLRLALATLITCLTSTLFPTTNYSIVVAAALAIEPAHSIEDAMSRAIAIMAGAAIGIVVSVSVWPQLARSRAFHAMSELLADCHALIAILPILNPCDNRAEVDALHERFLRHLVDARAVTSESRIRARFTKGPSLNAALVAFETLWHGLVLLDRVGQSQCGLLPDKDREALLERIDMVCNTARAYLEALAAYMRNDSPLPSSRDHLRPLHDASAAVRAHFASAIDARSQRSSEMQALCTLSFALDQIESNLGNIGKVLEQTVEA